MNIEIASGELVAVTVLLVLSVTGSVLVQLLYRRLETHHQRDWQRLGQPSLVKFSSGHMLLVARFIFGRRGAGGSDRVLKILAGLSLACSVAIVGQMLFIAFGM